MEAKPKGEWLKMTLPLLIIVGLVLVLIVLRIVA